MEQNLRRKIRKQKRRKRRLKTFLSIISGISLTIILIAGYMTYKTYSATQNSFEEINEDGKSDLRYKPVQISNDPVSVLIMGVEDYSTGGANGRTDSLILATFNPADHTVQMLSIPRDTRVEIAGKDFKDKINHAYFYNGKEGTIKTVENFLDIPVDYYVTVNFDGFKNVVDEIGGVEVDVPFDFHQQNDKGKTLYFKEGKMDLNGEEALAYARMRKMDPRGDFGRNERQQQIIKASIAKMVNPRNILKIDNIADDIGSNIKTNMSIGEALAFQQKYKNFNTNSIQTLSIGGEDRMINGIYYFSPHDDSIEDLQENLKEHLELDQMESEY